VTFWTTPSIAEIDAETVGIVLEDGPSFGGLRAPEHGKAFGWLLIQEDHAFLTAKRNLTHVCVISVCSERANITFQYYVGFPNLDCSHLFVRGAFFAVLQRWAAQSLS